MFFHLRGRNEFMNVDAKHSCDLTPSEAIALQRELAGRVKVCPLRQSVCIVAGVDCAFIGRSGPWAHRRKNARIIAGVVLCDAETMEVIERRDVVRWCAFPYVPGLLSFREAPAIADAIGRLSRRPDLLMVDGQGIAHPRGVGIASHLGLMLDMPSIGVAKSRLCGLYDEPALPRGSVAPLMLDNRRVGSVLRTRDGVKPLYVSPGHRVSIADADHWTFKSCRGVRLPEPTRRAHQHVSAVKKRRVGAS